MDWDDDDHHDDDGPSWVLEVLQYTISIKTSISEMLVDR